MGSDSISVITVLCSIMKDPSIRKVLHELKSYDLHTYSHCLRVSMLCGYIGKEMRFIEQELKLLISSALLHDIGKMHIPSQLLCKTESLTGEEMEILREHPNYSLSILHERCTLPKSIYDAVICHHERCNGTGYPKGCCGDEIPLFSRIIAVADTFDAITSDRPYSPPKSYEEAIQYMLCECGELLDHQAMDAFSKLFSVTS